MLSKPVVLAQNLELRKKGKRLSSERNSIRSVYNNKAGKDQLMRLISSGRVFGKIPCDNPEDLLGSVSVHNFAIGILEECGFFDETNMLSILDYLFTLPLIDRDIEK